MYYPESFKLIEQRPLDKQLIVALDRELAHAFAVSKRGYSEFSLLCHKTNHGAHNVQAVLDCYEDSGIVSSYDRVLCTCGDTYDPADHTCVQCGRLVTDATPLGQLCYRVLRQPLKPAYNPEAQVTSPLAFVSYRHADCSQLAADIYYSLQANGCPVFLDNGSMPVGADAERTFLLAASEAKHFIALVSQSYFSSDFCKKEIAHAARCRRRLIRVNVPPLTSAPNDMPWLDGPNWVSEQGDPSGLSVYLERSLLSVVQTAPSQATIADLRKDGCRFLLEQLSVTELERLWNRLPWMNDLEPVGSKFQRIRLILQEATPQRLPTLCNALAP